MDIARLPVTPLVRPTTASVNARQQPEPVRPVAETVDSLNPRPRAAARFEKVVQGELLERERTLFQSTRSFINERSLDQARPAQQEAAPANSSRSAITHYLSHVRPEPVAELTQGRSLDFFV